jgi:hypothetical protein
MARPTPLQSTTGALAAGAGALAAGYCTYALVTWLRYGAVPPPRPDDRDELLDRFMPEFEVVERHHVRVAAPAGVTLAAATDIDIMASPVVRAIVAARDLALGSTRGSETRPAGLLESMRSFGWGVLAESPGREIVVGAVTRPWEANVVFRAIPPAEFAGFSEPGLVKIAWTLRADPIGPAGSVFRTETRAVATDADARRRFRCYWALVSPGIVLIRRTMLGPIRREAERRAGAARDTLAQVDSAMSTPESTSTTKFA